MLWSELVVLGLFIRADNSFEVHVDGEKKASGSLLKDMQPPVNPPKETRLHRHEFGVPRGREKWFDPGNR